MSFKDTLSHQSRHGPVKLRGLTPKKSRLAGKTKFLFPTQMNLYQSSLSTVSGDSKAVPNFETFDTPLSLI